MSQFPPVAALLHKTIFNGDDMIFLPRGRIVIQESVRLDESTVLPSALVDHFIEQASDRFIMDTCICRESDHCQDYPHDLGCIFLGDAVRKISPQLGRLVSKEEALAHAHRADELGLVHLIGRDRLDTLWTGATPFGRLMTICNCCPCCCLYRMLPDLDARNRGKVVRMPGVSVWVEAEECVGCDACPSVCFVEAIRLNGALAEISEECRGCGRCVDACPTGAIHLEIEDTEAIQRQIARISGLVEVG